MKINFSEKKIIYLSVLFYLGCLPCRAFSLENEIWYGWSALLIGLIFSFFSSNFWQG